MTPEEVQEAIERLKQLQEFTDYEASHSEADQILCDCLSQLGFQSIVNEFFKVGRWYA